MSAAERADRLRALLAMNQGAPILTTQECGRAFTGDVRDLAVIETVQPDDCELASACLDIEGELQGRRWAALELLYALMPGCAGLRVCIGSQPEPREHSDYPTADPFAGLSSLDTRAALRALSELGWLHIERA